MKKSKNNPTDGIQRHPQHQRDRLWVVGLLAVVAVIGSITAYSLLRVHKTNIDELERRLPANAAVLFGADVYAITSNERIKSWLDQPLARIGLGTITSQIGVDLTRLNSIVGGIWMVDGTPLWLTVASGKFKPELFASMTEKRSENSVEIMGHQLYALPEAVQFQAFINDESGKDTHADAGRDILIGLLDQETLVLGEKSLISRYLKGSEPKHSDMEGLLEEVKYERNLWVVARSQGLPLVTKGIAKPEITDVLNKSSVAFSADFKNRIHLETNIFSNEKTATQSIYNAVKQLEILTSWSETMDTIMDGVDGPHITKTDHTVNVRIALPFPASIVP